MIPLLFEWDEANRLMGRHNVRPEEAEQVLQNDPLLRGFEAVEGEERWGALGRTDRGRILFVWWTVRGGRSERIRVVTAFEPIRRLRKLYIQTLNTDQ